VPKLPPRPTLSRPTRRAWLRAAVLGLMAGPASVLAAARDLRVLTPPDPSAWRALLSALKQRYPGAIMDTEPAPLEVRRNQNTPLLSLGPQALRKALAADVHAPLICALTSSQAYRRLHQAAGREPSGGVTAIFAEASPLAQMQLIAALFERRVTVGILLSEGSAYLERPLRQAAQTMGLDVQILLTSPGQDPVRAINALPSIQVLLAVPDASLYTPDALRAVLESTYRRGLPVIGFSAATVTAGTLACAHADLDDVAADLFELIDSVPPAGAPLPEPRYPRYWRVAINDNVARSLGLPVSDRVRALGSRPAGRAG
jgi:putative tryptophan/tyrosine transport system substrate-binding protein